MTTQRVFRSDNQMAKLLHGESELALRFCPTLAAQKWESTLPARKIPAIRTTNHMDSGSSPE